MPNHRSRFTTVVSLSAVAGALAITTGAASCATSGHDDNNNFADAAQSDATTDTGVDTGSPVEAAACDANTMIDLFNCGSCGHKCGSGQTCSCGMCQDFCPNGMAACCGQCVDLSKDPNNCGQCGNQCLAPSGGSVPGIPHCVASTCTFTCPAAGSEGGTIITCGGDAGTPGCYDPTSSAGACGGCGKSCAGGQDCVESQCCASGDGICGGMCTPLDTTAHCGACDAGCADGSTCTGGKCVGYGVSNPTVPFIDACALPGATTVLKNSNGGWAHTGPGLISFPSTFNFSFYGTPQTGFWLQNQGTMGIGADTNFFPPDSFPDCTASGDPTIGYPAAVAFGDSNMSTGPLGVCYALTGGASAGDAGTEAGEAGATSDGGTGPVQFVVTWKQATLFSDPGALLDVSIVLTQGTNTIDFQYVVTDADGGLDSIVSGGNATMGIQQGNGSTQHTVGSCGAPFITSSPYDVRFTP